MLKPEPDWAKIEADYRVGVDTLRAIAARYQGLNHVAIKRRADKEGWERDLSSRIAQKADALVTRDAVTTPVTRIGPVTEKQVIDANAEMQASIIRSERKDVKRARDLVSKLFSELEQVTDNYDLMEQLGELLVSPDDANIDKLNDAYRRCISLPGRVDMAKKLSETLEKVINTERRVYKIDDMPESDKPGGQSILIQIGGHHVDVKALGWVK